MSVTAVVNDGRGVDFMPLIPEFYLAKKIIIIILFSII